MKYSTKQYLDRKEHLIEKADERRKSLQRRQAQRQKVVGQQTTYFFDLNQQGEKGGESWQ